MTPIRTMETRFPRIGYLSVGHQVVGKSKKIHPTTTDTITVHASNPKVLEPFADVYGGKVVESPTSTEDIERWFLVTDAAAMPVMVPADLEISFSQWYEAWASSGLVRRCDGVDCVLWRKEPDKAKKEVVGELSDAIRPCLCEAEGGEERMCKPTVRLSVVPIEVAPDLPEIGVFTVRSTGFFTNSELKGDLELIRNVVGQLGVGVPLKLLVEQTRTRRGMKPKFRLTLGGTPREIVANLAAGPRPMMLPEPRPASPEEEEAVGAFVDKPSNPAASEPVGEQPGAATSVPASDVVEIKGIRIEFVGGEPTKPGGADVVAQAQLTQLVRIGQELGLEWPDICTIFAARHGFDGFENETPASKTLASDFTDFLRTERANREGTLAV